MAKKKRAVKKKQLAVTSTADLMGDAKNPRKISDESAEALGKSLKRFGDLSGIVFNMRTSELVAGHQRMEQIRAEWGDVDIEVLDLERGLGGIPVEGERFFPVRVVDWSPGKQRAANVAANNQKLQGKFTGELTTYLLELESEISEEMPGVMDDCLLTELAAAGMDLSDATETEEPRNDVDIKETYQVVVECQDEADQQAVYTQLGEQGYKCRVLTT